MPNPYQVLGGKTCDILVMGWESTDEADHTGCVRPPEHTGNCIDETGNLRNNQRLFRPRPGIINWDKIEEDIRLGIF